MRSNGVRFAISMLAFATACAKTIAVSRPISAERAAQLNEEIEGREAQVRLAEPTFSRHRPSQRDVKVDPNTEPGPLNFGSPAGDAVVGALSGGLSFALLGTAAGLVIGAPTTIEFDDRPSDRAGGPLRPAGAGSPAAP